MADTTPIVASPLQFIQGEADGYCDPVTGLCMLPGAPNPPHLVTGEIPAAP